MTLQTRSQLMKWLPICSGKRWSGLKNSGWSKKRRGKRKPPRQQSIRLNAQVRGQKPKNRIPNPRVYRIGLTDKNARGAAISRGPPLRQVAAKNEARHGSKRGA